MKRHFTRLVSLIVIAIAMLALTACNLPVNPDEQAHNGIYVFNADADGDGAEVTALPIDDDGYATVNASGAGVLYSFTAKVNGSFMLLNANADLNFEVRVNGSVIDALEGYSFSLNSGETIVFAMHTVDGTDDSFLVTLTAQSSEVVESLNFLLDNDGNATVNASATGIKHSFTPKFEGTYVITCENANAVILLEGANGVEEIASGYEFTLAGGETIYFVMATADNSTGSYSINISEKSGDEPVGNVLTGGPQTVTASYFGNSYTFTAKVANTYVITWNHANASILVETAAGAEEISSGYEFTLASGESIAIIMCTNDGDDSYEINIAVKEEPSYVLTGGSQTVEASYDGIAYTFTAKVGNTYVITWSHENAYVMAENASGAESIDSGYEFTLASGESIAIIMCTNEGDDSYEINIAVKEEPSYVLTGGSQTVEASYDGIAYTFTAKVENTYVITWTSENAYVMAENASGAEEISSGYEFTLASGESITIIMCTNDGDDSYEINIAVKEEEPNYLQTDFDGNATVNANGEGIVYMFSAMMPDTYVITWSDPNAYVMIVTADGSEEIQSGYTFELSGRGDSVSFIMCTNDFSASSYDVNVSSYVPAPIEFEFDADGNATVDANFEGIKYQFTPKAPGSYVITWTDANAYVMLITDDSSEVIDSGYVFDLSRGASICFAMSTNDMTDGSYSINISAYVPAPIELIPDADGNVTVNATGDGIEYVFTAKVAGTYVITTGDDNALLLLVTANGAEEIASGYEFTLSARQSITFAMSTKDWSTGSYVVSLSVKAEEAIELELDDKGNATVNADGAGIEYVFSGEAGKYVITWSDENAVILLVNGDAIEEISSGYAFELAEGETIVLAMATADFSEASYSIKIAEKRGASGKSCKGTIGTSSIILMLLACGSVAILRSKKKD